MRTCALGCEGLSLEVRCSEDLNLQQYCWEDILSRIWFFS